MKNRDKTIELRGAREAAPLRIVADAAIATVAIGDGRLIPLVIVDTTARQDIDELVRVHQYLPSGDVSCQWAQIHGHKGTISLVLTFIRPAELTAILEFDITNQGGLVDQILTASGLYIQPGREGDRLVSTMNNPRILVEVGDLGFGKQWNEMLRKHIVKKLRADGLSRRESKEAVERFLQEWRKLGSMRMKR